jgi:5-deoxy-glucuronate isomerase
MSESTLTIEQITRNTCVVRRTAAAKGRTKSVSPGLTASRHLHYGRIILDAGDPTLSVDTGGLETGFIALRGEATIAVAGASHVLRPYDALYVPRDSKVAITPGDAGCDLAEVAAPVDRSHPVQFVSFAGVQADAGLHFAAGGPSAKRNLNVLLGKNVEAGRIMAGVTFSEPGNWTSWPPHEHAVLAEEAYLYIDMPAPAFGVQLVYTNPNEPELAAVREKTDRDARVPEQALELVRRRVVPGSRHVFGLVERKPEVRPLRVVAEVPDESDPG